MQQPINQNNRMPETANLILPLKITAIPAGGAFLAEITACNFNILYFYKKIRFP